MYDFFCVCVFDQTLYLSKGMAIIYPEEICQFCCTIMMQVYNLYAFFKHCGLDTNYFKLLRHSKYSFC